MKTKSVLLFVLAGWLAAGLPGKMLPVSPAQPGIQLAILLDTSGSMDGLIDQARSRLWKIVNELATARKNGLAPKLAGGLVRIRPGQHPGRRRLPALHRAAERRPRPDFRRIVQAEDQRRPGILRPGHRHRGARAPVERQQRRPEDDRHRRQRAVQPGRDRLQGLVPPGHRPRHHGQHHFLRQLPGRPADGMESRRRPGRRPVPGHRRRPDAAAGRRPAGPGDRPAQPGIEPDLCRLRQGRGRRHGAAKGAGPERGHRERRGHWPSGRRPRRRRNTATRPGTWSTRKKRGRSSWKKWPKPSCRRR